MYSDIISKAEKHIWQTKLLDLRYHILWHLFGQRVIFNLLLIPSFFVRNFRFKYDNHVIFFHVVSSVFRFGKTGNHLLYWYIYERDLYRGRSFLYPIGRGNKVCQIHNGTGGPVKWMDKKEAMQLLRIKSATTLQKLRDEGKIRFSQPEKKHIVYDRGSINDYLEAHAREPFNDK